MKKLAPTPSIFFVSLGCPRNLVDTEVMIGILLKKGYDIAQTIEEASHIVINTCGFLEEARRESIETIQNSIRTKKKTAKVIVTGCMVQIQASRLQEECPGIHFLLGSGDTMAIINAIESSESGTCITDAKSFLEMGEVPRTLSTAPHIAYLKIAEGCRKRCAYCIIPTIKGPLKSKPLEQIIRELKILLSQGVREIILIAQDLGDWGKDLGFKKSHGLCHLLQEMIQEPQNFKIRLLYLYPDEITDELIAIMQNSSKILPYLDMPIQHINDELLKRMNRNTSKEQILSLLKKLRVQIPNITIRTSLIVGFPGETEEQFQELADFLKTAELDNVGIFEYSREETSASNTFPDHISDDIKKKRAQKLASIQKKIATAKSKSFIGKTIPVIVEKYHPESPHLLVGRHDGQAPDIDGTVIINDFRKVKAFGERYMVTITDAFEYDLVGTVVKKEQTKSL